MITADGDVHYTDHSGSMQTWYTVSNNPGTGPPQDLCEGAGGDYIYLYYTRDLVD